MSPSLSSWPRERVPAPGTEALELPARGDRGLEDVRRAVPADGREVAHLERHAQIGLVRAVLLHGFGVGQTRERARELPVGQGEDGLHQPLVEGEELLPVDEAHFDVDLGEFGLTVGPEVLVPETADDLEVAVETGDHQGLLELLGRLRQGVEAALVDSAGDEVVARPFGRGVGQDGRLDLEETGPAHVVAHGQRGLVPETNVALHLRAAQVEVAVLKAQLLGGLRRVGDDERRNLGGRENAELERLDLDLARGDVLVHGRAAADAAADPDDELVAEPLGLFHEFGAVGLEDDLGQALTVAEVDEDEMSHVTGLVDPAAEHDLPALVCRP